MDLVLVRKIFTSAYPRKTRRGEPRRHIWTKKPREQFLPSRNIRENTCLTFRFFLHSQNTMLMNIFIFVTFLCYVMLRFVGNNIWFHTVTNAFISQNTRSGSVDSRRHWITDHNPGDLRIWRERGLCDRTCADKSDARSRSRVANETNGKEKKSNGGVEEKSTVWTWVRYGNKWKNSTARSDGRCGARRATDCLHQFHAFPCPPTLQAPPPTPITLAHPLRAVLDNPRRKRHDDPSVPPSFSIPPTCLLFLSLVSFLSVLAFFLSVS